MNALMNKFLNVLRKLNRTRISFSDGSYIEYFNREAILYVEPNGYKMEIAWYFQYWFKKGRILYASDINAWDAPYEKEVISPQKKKEIQNKIIEYCQKRRISLEFQEKPEQLIK